MITSTENSRIRSVVGLRDKAKERAARGAWIAEGYRMVRDMPRELFSEVYVSESFLEKAEREAGEAAAFLAEISYEPVSDRVMKHMADTKTPQGILCVARCPSYTAEEILGKSDGMVLMLENIQDPGNLGTMVRSAEAAGAAGILMSKETVDITNPKTLRASMGALCRVPFCYAKDWNGCIRFVQETGRKVYAAYLQGSVPYDRVDYTGGCGILIGNEGGGLKEETAMLADERIRIPMHGQVESLNAAIAATVIMYEALRQREA